VYCPPHFSPGLMCTDIIILPYQYFALHFINIIDKFSSLLIQSFKVHLYPTAIFIYHLLCLHPLLISPKFTVKGFTIVQYHLGFGVPFLLLYMCVGYLTFIIQCVCAWEGTFLWKVILYSVCVCGSQVIVLNVFKCCFLGTCSPPSPPPYFFTSFSLVHQTRLHSQWTPGILLCLLWLQMSATTSGSCLPHPQQLEYSGEQTQILAFARLVFSVMSRLPSTVFQLCSLYWLFTPCHQYLLSCLMHIIPSFCPFLLSPQKQFSWLYWLWLHHVYSYCTIAFSPHNFGPVKANLCLTSENTYFPVCLGKF
jgi:hypothetical protein